MRQHSCIPAVILLFLTQFNLGMVYNEAGKSLMDYFFLVGSIAYHSSCCCFTVP